MARHPDVFVRELSMTEGQKLQRITRTAKDPVKLRRAIVVLMSGQGQAVSDIVDLLQVDEGYARDVIHAFNERGFDALNPKWSGGRPPATDKTTRQKVVAVAKTDPHALGLPFSCWSLAKLTAHLAREKITQVGREAIRRILRTENVTFQTTTTWKPSNDPDFVIKMNRVLELYDCPPADGRVICYDEFGPLNLLPRPGKQWAPVAVGKGTTQAPRRRTRRATYNRPNGVRHLMAGYDLSTDKLYGHVTKHKGRVEFLAFCRYLRRLYPPEVRIAIVLDNFSPHRSTKTDQSVGDWARDNNVELAYVPFYGSWLNRIEAQFTALRYFALDGTDHNSHAEQASMIRRYIAWRNRHAATHPRLREVVAKAETIKRAKVA